MAKPGEKGAESRANGASGAASPLRSEVKRIAVFCGSRAGDDRAFIDGARRFGRCLVEAGCSLVYGGGRVGMMGELADSVLERGGEVIGVIPRALVARERGHSGVTRLLVVESMHERKAKMADLADAFAALPGGLGTLEEICEVLTWAVLGIHRKPCGFLNLRGYFDPLFAFFSRAVDRGFLDASARDAIVVDEDAVRLIGRLRTSPPLPTLDHLWRGER
jgi:uncharacterized protein (TIGR00730 family)